MKHRTIEALRALAERPGTEAEGIVAREILARYETRVADAPDEPWDWEAELATRQAFWSTLHGDDLLEAIQRSIREELALPFPSVWRCACGAVVRVSVKCTNQAEHLRIQEEIRRRFKPGDRVIYKRFPWLTSDPGVVVGYVKPKPENGTHPWAWIRVKFDRSKNPIQIPIKSATGWYLEFEPEKCAGQDASARAR